MNANKIFIKSIFLLSAFMYIKQRVNLERNIKTGLRKSLHRLIYSACLFDGGMGAGGIIDHVTKIINKQIMNKICDQKLRIPLSTCTCIHLATGGKGMFCLPSGTESGLFLLERNCSVSSEHCPTLISAIALLRLASDVLWICNIIRRICYLS